MGTSQRFSTSFNTTTTRCTQAIEQTYTYLSNFPVAKAHSSDYIWHCRDRSRVTHIATQPYEYCAPAAGCLQNSIAKQVATINQVRTSINNQNAISEQERALIDKILSETMTQLQQSKNEAQAQQVLAQAQAKLDQLRDPQATIKAEARAALSSSLRNSSNTNLNAAGKALATGDSQGLNNALQKLASQISSMTTAQRAQLAQQIEQAANQALGNPQLSSALHQLAKAVAGGSPSEVSDAAKAFETAAAHDSANQAASNTIHKADQTLQNVSDPLASNIDNSNIKTAGQGQSSSQGQNQGAPGKGQGQGKKGTAGDQNKGETH